MTTPVWPIPSRGVEVSGYSETWDDQYLETPMSTGFPNKRRLRFSGQMYDTSGSITVSKSQMAAIKTWFQTQLSAGALPFSWELPSTGETVLARFTSKLKWKALGNDQFQMAFSVRIDPQ